MQSLHIKVTQIPPNVQDCKPPFQWGIEELQIIEQFFELRVAAPPYRPTSLQGFTRMLNVPPQVLKDFIQVNDLEELCQRYNNVVNVCVISICLQIIRLELMPDMIQGLKWHVQVCLRVPPSAAPVVPVGSAAIHTVRLKILFFLQITRIPYMPGMDWKDSPSLVLPIIYDISSNITQLAERREPVPSGATSAISHLLKRFFADYPTNLGDCSLFPAVRDLVMNLQLQNEPQPPPQILHQV